MHTPDGMGMDRHRERQNMEAAAHEAAQRREQCDHEDTHIEPAEQTDGSPPGGVEARVCDDCGEVQEVL